MKKKLYIFLFLSLTSILNAQNKDLHIIIDTKYKDLFKFDKKTSIDNDYYFSSIKILKHNKKHKGFNKKEDNLNNNDIVIVTKQPTENNYYEFQSYKKPEKTININHLKIYS